MYAIDSVHARLRRIRGNYYRPEELADAILISLERMERESNRPMQGCRSRSGVVNAAWFRNHASIGDVENAITRWLAELIPNGNAQVDGVVRGVRPDLVFSYERDEVGDDVLVVLEAKPVWHRWIEQTGEKKNKNLSKNLQQLEDDRDKLSFHYTASNFRLMLLALVFQGAGELDQRVVQRVGPGWQHRSRHVIDQCNCLGGSVGLTGIVFWPDRGQLIPQS